MDYEKDYIGGFNLSSCGAIRLEEIKGHKVTAVGGRIKRLAR